MQQSVASSHLKILRKAGFVITERAGEEIYYSLNYYKFSEVDNQVKAILK